MLFVSSEARGRQDIFRANADGSGPQNLTQDIALDIEPGPLTAPKSFAFASDRDSAPQFEIHVLSKETGSRANITGHPSHNGGPSWFDPALPVPVRGAVLTTRGWLRQLQGARHWPTLALSDNDDYLDFDAV